MQAEPAVCKVSRVLERHECALMPQSQFWAEGETSEHNSLKLCRVFLLLNELSVHLFYTSLALVCLHSILRPKLLPSLSRGTSEPALNYGSGLILKGQVWSWIYLEITAGNRSGAGLKTAPVQDSALKNFSLTRLICSRHIGQIILCCFCLYKPQMQIVYEMTVSGKTENSP